ncbi:DUF6333 family protein [Streptomyces sp. NPDC006208]|uniref:DUF6333 family protein n=1 Tax=Streptomyces sp. NPDC006208 TaxID=3156734 RepID=UPI0033A0D630
MTDDSFWSADQDQEIVRHGEFRLTVVHAPRPGNSASLPAHDPDRAREFVASFGTIDAVVEELDPIRATEPVPLGTRRDLDLVRVGCWGSVSEIIDPALGHCGDSFPVLEQSEALRERFPDAVIVASATIDYNMTYGAWAIFHPDGTSLFAAGWHGEENWDCEGDAKAVVSSFGIPGAALVKQNVDLDDAVNVFNWGGLAQLALARVAPLSRENRSMSVYRVRHTEDTTFDMEETWLEE